MISLNVTPIAISFLHIFFYIIFSVMYELGLCHYYSLVIDVSNVSVK